MHRLQVSFDGYHIVIDFRYYIFYVRHHYGSRVIAEIRDDAIYI